MKEEYKSLDQLRRKNAKVEKTLILSS